MNKPKDAKPSRFWNLAEINGADEATLTFYGDVVSEKPRDWWTGEELDTLCVCPEDFLADLEKIKDKSVINININSCGGDVYTALAIHNTLKALPAKKNVIIDGIAASAASVLAMAGDTIKVFPGSLVMIHGVLGFVCDWLNVEALKRMTKSFDAVNRAIAAIYAARTGNSEESVLGMMSRETWMTGSEAISKGFATELMEGASPEMSYNAKHKMLFVNGVPHRAEGLSIPERLNIKPATESEPVATVIPEDSEEKGRKVFMTIDELRKEHPELVAQIEAEAVAADRARIQEIEEIQNTIGDAELIASAKFTKPVNAAELALAAMKKQAALGADFLNRRTQETKPANEVPAGKAPEVDPAVLEAEAKAKEKEAIKNLSEQFKNVFHK